MAAYTITASAVKWISGPKSRGTAGEAVAAGDWVYLKNDDKYWKAQADATPDDQAGGIALCSCAAEQELTIAEDGAIVQVDTGLFTHVGIPLFLHATAGKMGQLADLASTNYLTYLAFTVATNQMQLMIKATGKQVA